MQGRHVMAWDMNTRLSTAPALERQVQLPPELGPSCPDLPAHITALGITQLPLLALLLLAPLPLLLPVPLEAVLLLDG